MRILMLTHEFPPAPGGVATYCLDLATAAHEIGHDITVVAPDCGAPRGPDVPFRVCRFRGGVYSWRSLIPLLARTIGQVSRRGRYDLIHAANWPWAMALSLINRATRTPFLASTHGAELLGVRQPHYLGLTGPFDGAEDVIANSNYVRALFLRGNRSFPPEHVRVAPLGVHNDWFEPVSNSSMDELRRDLGIAPGQKIVLTAARHVPTKGHRTVIEALGRLPQDLKRTVTYVSVGHSPEPSYTSLLAQNATDAGVTFITRSAIDPARLRALYRMSDLFCMVSDAEPFGLVYLEAAAQALPAIAANSGGAPEVVAKDQTGILVPPKDPDALAAALIDMLEHPRLVEDLGRAAQDRARTFTWRACAEATYGAA